MVTMTFLKRFIIILAALLCCCQSWVDARRVNCEYYPYHPSCRGVMARKRAAPSILRSYFECNDDDCRLSNLKYLVTLLNGEVSRR